MRSVLVALLFLLVAFAGCFGGDDAPPGDGDSMPDGDATDNGNMDTGGDGENTTEDDLDNGTEEDPEPGPKRDPVTWEISIQGNDFVDGSITVQVGDTVTWVHEDGTTPHTVTSSPDGTDFDSGTCPGPGCMTETVNNEFSHTFDAVGDFGYFCRVHPSMTDTITVLERHDATPS